MTEPAPKRARGILLGAPNAVRDDTLLERFRLTGRNTGNLFIGAGMTAVVDADLERGAAVENAPRMRERCQFVAIAAANFLTPHFDMGHLADLVEALNLPTVMIGLGAQTPRLGDKVEIPEGTQRMLDAVASRTVSIGVRGANTAQVMNDLGYKNVTVTGCPSLYSITNPKFAPSASRDPSSFMINGSYNVVGHSMAAERMRAIEGSLYRQAIAHGADYVLQNEHAEFEILEGQEAAARVHYLKREMPALAELSDEQIEAFVRQHCKVFFDTTAWVDFARGKTVSIGTRFHGNVAALQAGTPAFFICHDARTTEMCQFAHLPHVSIEALDDTSFDALAERADLSAFERRRPKLHADFAAFLRANNVPMIKRLEEATA